jgi:hypothetical protein
MANISLRIISLLGFVMVLFEGGFWVNGGVHVALQAVDLYWVADCSLSHGYGSPLFVAVRWCVAETRRGLV